MRVALSTIPAFAKEKFLPGLGQVGDRLLFDLGARLVAGTPNDRPYRNQNPRRLRTPALFVFSLAVRTALGADQWLEKKRHKAVGVRTRHKDNIPAPPAIPAIGTAARDEFFPPETAAAIAPVASLGVDSDLIDKLHLENLPAPPSRVEREFPANWRPARQSANFFP